jgi:hypothetical protein
MGEKIDLAVFREHPSRKRPLAQVFASQCHAFAVEITAEYQRN